MVVLLSSQHLHLPFLSPPPSPPKRSNHRTSISMTSSSSSSSSPYSHKDTRRSSLLEFPHLSPSHRELMLDLISTVETRLGPHLLPSAVPPDVAYFQTDSGNSQGSLDIRSGRKDSKIDFILGSWLHCLLPSGAALDIATLFAYLSPKTDAPHLLLEFIQSSPTSLILFMDLLPRKDLVLHPNYLETFYQNTQLDAQRSKLLGVPNIKTYFSSSLYIRSVLSPTAIAMSINCEEGSVDEIMRDYVDSVAKELVRIWLDECAVGGKEIEEDERDDLVRRDDLLKRKTVEIDLASNLPRLFGADAAGRIVDEIQKVFGID
ncbi:red chlorophyll catabolite reductase [Magnolia sinica]|uniref:red chlorophyll catabolite reductase n=1 Tax=Magnolia sinica TaxID=86752 RepID=UPI002659D6AC|nr:red chlorophyll catabolite reductase [Magnolia sinica]